MAEKLITDYLDGIDDTSLLVFVSDDFMYFRDCIRLTESLIRDFRMAGVVVLLNRHAKVFMDVVRADKVPSNDLWLIDCVSMISGFELPPEKNCIMLRHPDNQEELMLTLTEALSNLESKKRKFVLLVSPHVFQDFMGFDSVGMFFCQYKDFLRNKDSFDVIVLEKEGNKTFETMIMNLADAVVRT